MAKDVSILGAYRRLWPYLARYRRRALWIVVLGAVAAGGSKLTMVFFKPLVDRLFPDTEAAGAGAGSFLDRFTRGTVEPFLDRLPGLGMPQAAVEVLFLVVLMLALAAGFAAAHYVFVRLSRMLGVHMITDLRQDLAEHVIGLGMGYHTERRLGDLVSRLTVDVNTSLRILNLMVEELVNSPFSILAALLVAFAAEPVATMGMLVFLPLLAWPIMKIGPKIRTRSRESQERLGDTTQSLMQMLSGIRVVKAFRMERREAEEFRRGNQEFLRDTRRMVRAQAASLAVTSFFANGGIGAVLGALVLVHLLVTPIFSDVGSMFTFFVAIGTLYAYVKRLTKAVSTIYTSLGAIDRVFEVFEIERDRPAAGEGRDWGGLREEIRFEDVGFRYGADEPWALRGVRFTARRGERVALVGLSGAGKSTLLDLIARFYAPSEGRIVVDGTDLAELREDAWLDRIAVVQQQPFLFQASIRDNVRYGRPGASEEEVARACAAARVDEFARTLPDGLDTRVGDAGARLSGGQAQRVTIARALLKDAEILLLDEATSALDSESERAVQEALENLMRGRTTFVIAHRLSTIRSADRILVLEEGRLVEEGDHDGLLARDGAYARLWRLQAGADADQAGAGTSSTTA